MEPIIDLHMHSTYSDDGSFSPAQLVRLCQKANITTLSITDHNSAKANKEARQEAEKLGLQYISGIEIDCRFQGVNLHLLGYGFDENSNDFLEIEDRILTGERQASAARLELMKALGFVIREDELNAISNLETGGIWTGEVFAEVLLHKEEYEKHPYLLPYKGKGARSDNPYVNFYWDYFSQGKPCYVEIDFPDLREAIEIIHKNDGKAVLAHPGLNLKDRYTIFEQIIQAGIDGVEVFCSYHDEKAANYFLQQALAHKLIITCGSDFHGKTKPSVQLGGHNCKLSSNHILRNLL